ncbi:hypothetical protein B0T20DRAFT_391144 [Sordaria brevicollis]|uniref:Uncharacterized protein n=1 Tax=Sordaria brevicollis TaxID=83679 RepID=A0AAE0PGN9_SORBR|nr:hypothetical protein B0T20DRAFT_391144 [Sordaria brevicollis]
MEGKTYGNTVIMQKIHRKKTPTDRQANKAPDATGKQRQAALNTKAQEPTRRVDKLPRLPTLLLTAGMGRKPATVTQRATAPILARRGPKTLPGKHGQIQDYHQEHWVRSQSLLLYYHCVNVLLQEDMDAVVSGSDAEEHPNFQSLLSDLNRLAKIDPKIRVYVDFGKRYNKEGTDSSVTSSLTHTCPPPSRSLLPPRPHPHNPNSPPPPPPPPPCPPPPPPKSLRSKTPPSQTESPTKSHLSNTLWSLVLNDVLDAAPELGQGINNLDEADEATDEAADGNPILIDDRCALTDAMEEVKAEIFHFLYEEGWWFFPLASSSASTANKNEDEDENGDENGDRNGNEDDGTKNRRELITEGQVLYNLACAMWWKYYGQKTGGGVCPVEQYKDECRLLMREDESWLRYVVARVEKEDMEKEEDESEWVDEEEWVDHSDEDDDDDWDGGYKEGERPSSEFERFTA